MTWAEPCDGHSRRVFDIDITRCPDCGGRLRWIADVTPPTVIRKILLSVQSQAPPGSALRGEHHTQADMPFTRAGRADQRTGGEPARGARSDRP